MLPPLWSPPLRAHYCTCPLVPTAIRWQKLAFSGCGLLLVHVTVCSFPAPASSHRSGDSESWWRGGLRWVTPSPGCLPGEVLTGSSGTGGGKGLLLLAREIHGNWHSDAIKSTPILVVSLFPNKCPFTEGTRQALTSTCAVTVWPARLNLGPSCHVFIFLILANV